MKKNNQGFIIPAMIAIVLILTFGGGTYVYLESKKVDKVEIDNENTTTLPTTTNTNYENNSIVIPSSEIKKEVKATGHSTSSIAKIQSVSTVSDTKLKSIPDSSEKCSDAKCFINALNKCSPASYQLKNENEMLGSLIKTEILFNLYKSKNDCLVNYKLISYNISPTKGLTEAIGNNKVSGQDPYPLLNKYAEDNTIGKSATCNITNNIKDFSNLFNNTLIDKNGKLELLKYQNEVILVLFPDDKICSGKLIDSLNKQAKDFQ